MNQFNSIEKQAIFNITMLMMMVDGHVAGPEADYWRKVGNLLEMSDTEKQAAAAMKQKTAISTIRSMNARNKIIASKIFTEMMMADGKIDIREHQLLNNLLDEMNILTAAQIEGLENIKAIVAPYAK